MSFVVESVQSVTSEASGMCFPQRLSARRDSSPSVSWRTAEKAAGRAAPVPSEAAAAMAAAEEKRED